MILISINKYSLLRINIRLFKGSYHKQKKQHQNMASIAEASIAEAIGIPTREATNMFIHNIVNTYSIVDGRGYIINPIKLIELLKNRDDDSPKLLTMNVKEIRLNFNTDECLSQYPELTNRRLIDEEEDKSLTEKDKVLIIFLMGVLRDMFQLEPTYICISYMEYVANRGEYVPLGIKIKFYDNKPEEIIGELNI